MDSPVTSLKRFAAWHFFSSSVISLTGLSDNNTLCNSQSCCCWWKQLQNAEATSVCIKKAPSFISSAAEASTYDLLLPFFLFSGMFFCFFFSLFLSQLHVNDTYLCLIDRCVWKLGHFFSFPTTCFCSLTCLGASFPYSLKNVSSQENYFFK